MSEQKHTPGPWRANSSWIESPQMALRVAVIDWPKRGRAPKSENEAKANARLIAAAPEMYEALNALLEQYGVHSNHAIKMAIDAKTKAEGRTC